MPSHFDNSRAYFDLFLQSDRLHKVFEYVNEVHSLCGVLGIDFGKTVSGVHPSLHGTQQEQSTNISNSTLEGLEQAIRMLKLERKARIQKVMHIHPFFSI
jgi:protein regulator of cytokinesis 1